MATWGTAFFVNVAEFMIHLPHTLGTPLLERPEDKLDTVFADCWALPAALTRAMLQDLARQPEFRLRVLPAVAPLEASVVEEIMASDWGTTGAGAPSVSASSTQREVAKAGAPETQLEQATPTEDTTAAAQVPPPPDRASVPPPEHHQPSTSQLTSGPSENPSAAKKRTLGVALDLSATARLQVMLSFLAGAGWALLCYAVYYLVTGAGRARRKAPPR